MLCCATVCACLASTLRAKEHAVLCCVLVWRVLGVRPALCVCGMAACFAVFLGLQALCVVGWWAGRQSAGFR